MSAAEGQLRVLGQRIVDQGFLLHDEACEREDGGDYDCTCLAGRFATALLAATAPTPDGNRAEYHEGCYSFAELEQAEQRGRESAAPTPDKPGQRIVLHIDPPDPQIVPVRVPCPRCGTR